MNQDLETSDQPTFNLKGRQVALLVIAFVLTIASAGIGVLMFAFTNDPSNHNFFHRIVWIAPIVALPVFLLAFVSRRMLSWALWLVWVLCCLGVLAINLEDRVRVVFAVLAAIANVNGILSLASALIVQFVAASESQHP